VSGRRWSLGRLLLVLAAGGLALVVVAGGVLLKLAELSYRNLEATRVANERAAVRELRRLVATRRPDGPPPAPAVEEAEGYRRRLLPGAAAGRFVYMAVPLERGESGRSSFCADASGVLRFDLEGADPPTADGACPAHWLILREDLTAPLP
jgi:hypothetical protein